MDVEEETAASPPFSFSAAWSASSASSVSAFFAPRSRPSVSAPVPSASSASFSSPNLADSSSSSSSSQIVWVDRSSDKTWTSAVWQLDLFETSKEKVDEVHFKVRCKACGWEILLDGTTAVANHAKKHSQNVKVQNWLLRKAQDASERKQIAASSEAEFIAVCCRFLLVTFHYLLPALSLRKNMASTTTFDLLLKPMRGRRRWEKESRSGTGAPNSMRSSAGLCTTSFFLMAILFQPLRARG